jgi:hypothetical protein
MSNGNQAAALWMDDGLLMRNKGERSWSWSCMHIQVRKERRRETIGFMRI